MGFVLDIYAIWFHAKHSLALPMSLWPTYTHINSKVIEYFFLIFDDYASSHCTLIIGRSKFSFTVQMRADFKLGIEPSNVFADLNLFADQSIKFG